MFVSFGRNADVPRLTVDGQAIDRVEQAKLLGLTISSDLTWSAHVQNIISKAGKRIYSLYQMKRAGVTSEDLLHIYTVVIRPVLEYACQVWHTCLPAYLTESLESVQKRAMRCIFPGMDYADVLVQHNVTSLFERREAICDKYFKKLLDSSHKLNYLITKAPTCSYNLRVQRRYCVPRARTNRFKNSFIPAMLRKHNR